VRQEKFATEQITHYFSETVQNRRGFYARIIRRTWQVLAMHDKLLSIEMRSWSYNLFTVDLCNRADHYIFALWFLSFFVLLLLQSEIGCLPYFHTWCDLSANLECISEMCCTRLAENTGRKKSPFWHHRTTLPGCVFAAEACIDNRKNLVKHRYLLYMLS